MSIPKITYDKDVIPLRDTEQKMLDLLSNGKAFVNIRGEAITALLSAAETEIELIEPSTMLPAEKDEIEEALTALQVEGNLFLEHTNYLSGVTQDSTIDKPALINVLSIGQNYFYFQAQRGEINLDEPIEGVLGFFSSIYNSEEIINQITEFVPGLVSKVETFEITAAEASSSINALIGSLSVYREADESYYNEAKNYILNQSSIYTLISGALDPHIDTLYKSIGTQELQDLAYGIV